jgi:hypothetical protein
MTSVWEDCGHEVCGGEAECLHCCITKLKAENRSAREWIRGLVGRPVSLDELTPTFKITPPDRSAAIQNAQDRITKLQAQNKAAWESDELQVEMTLAAQKRADEAEAQLTAMREWLDNNATFYEPETSNRPILAMTSKRIWYHATDDQESYPFSNVVDKAIGEGDDS